MADSAIKERTHELIDRATPEHVAESVAMLEWYADPVAYSLTASACGKTLIRS